MNISYDDHDSDMEPQCIADLHGILLKELGLITGRETYEQLMTKINKAKIENQKQQRKPVETKTPPKIKREESEDFPTFLSRAKNLKDQDKEISQLESVVENLKIRTKNVFNLEIFHHPWKRIAVPELLAGLEYVQQNYSVLPKEKTIDIYDIESEKSQGLGRVMVTLDNTTIELFLVWCTSMVSTTFELDLKTNTLKRL